MDQPEVIDFKVRTLAAMKATPTATQLHSIGIDLRLDWAAALRTQGFDTSLPTAWIAEGLHGYLPADAQDRFLDTITDLSAPASRIAIDWHPDLNIASNARSREVSQSERQRSNGVDIKDPSSVHDLPRPAQQHRRLPQRPRLANPNPHRRAEIRRKQNDLPPR